jgi:hypothetical protein
LLFQLWPDSCKNADQLVLADLHGGCETVQIGWSESQCRLLLPSLVMQSSLHRS